MLSNEMDWNFARNRGSVTLLLGEEMSCTRRAVLINMPFGGVDRPSLGLSLLKSYGQRESWHCDVAYFNLRFAEIIGKAQYDNLSNNGALDPADGIPYTVMAGEWLFARWLFGDDLVRSNEYESTILRPVLSSRAIASLYGIAAVVPDFLEECFRRVDWDAYDLICFTSTFEQNLASLALAALIKDRHPKAMIAMGGANCEDVMGRKLAENFPFIDAVCLGEGDEVFPAMLRALSGGGDLRGVRGLSWRDSKGVLQHEGVPALVTDLNSVPPPDFDDYFEQLAASPLGSQTMPWIQLEASRGCWWGEKHHCTFCGLNGKTMAYRRKSAERVIAEVRANTERYMTRHVSFTDNILDYKAFNDLLPMLAEELPGLHIFMEVKPNLRRDQVRALAIAGITDVQPGIESFSTAVLQQMRKGATGLQNIAFLRNAAEFGVRPLWNILYGFPCEDAQEYDSQLELMRRITHLEPPTTICQIRLDRFSPNYHEREERGFVNVRPMRPYYHLYPTVNAVDVEQIAYFFDYNYIDGRTPSEYTQNLVAFWRRWIEQNEDRGTLMYFERPDGAELRDSRFNRRLDLQSLNSVEDYVYRLCLQPQTAAAVARAVSAEFIPLSETDAAHLLEEWYENYLVVRDSNKYLSVALMLRAADYTLRSVQVSEKCHND